MNNRTQMQLFRCDQRKTVLQVKAHLVAKHAPGAGTGAIVFLNAVKKHVPHEVFILVLD